MAKQKGIITLIGKIGDRVYYYDRNRGYLVRKVTSVDAERIRTDPAFARVRENNVEFGHCAWMVKLLRAAFKPLFAGIADTRMTARLTKATTAMMRSDMTSGAGMRRPENGDAQLLRGFEFNKHASVETVLQATYQAGFDSNEKKCTLTITPSESKKMVKAPKGATHFRLIAGMAAIDFKTGNYILDTVRSEEMAVRQGTDAPVTLTSPLAPMAGEGLFITLGIEFLQLVNGVYCPLQSTGYNVMTLVHAAQILQPVEPLPSLGREYTDDILLPRGKRMVRTLYLHECGRRQRFANGFDQRPLRQRIARTLEEQHRQRNRRQMVRPTRVGLLRRMQRKPIEHNTT
jgi:hypothetical protein